MVEMNHLKLDEQKWTPNVVYDVVPPAAFDYSSFDFSQGNDNVDQEAVGSSLKSGFVSFFENLFSGMGQILGGAVELGVGVFRFFADGLGSLIDGIGKAIRGFFSTTPVDPVFNPIKTNLEGAMAPHLQAIKDADEKILELQAESAEKALVTEQLRGEVREATERVAATSIEVQEALAKSQQILDNLPTLSEEAAALAREQFREELNTELAAVNKSLSESEQRLADADSVMAARVGLAESQLKQIPSNIATVERRLSAADAVITKDLAAAKTAVDQATFDINDPAGKLQTVAKDVAEQLSTLDIKLSQDIKRSANGKNSITIRYNANPHTAGSTVGDIWWRTDEAGNVVGFWTWNGSIWTEKAIEHQVISSVDVNKLTVASTATMNEAVVNKIWADGIAAKSITAARISISGDGNLLPEIQSFVGATTLSNRGEESPYREFGFNSNDPSMWIKGRKGVYVYQPIQLTAGEEYVFEFDVKSTVAGTSLYWQLHAGSIDAPNSPSSSIDVSVRGGTSSYLVTNYLVSGAMSWNRAEVIFTALESTTAWLFLYANHQNGTANEEGYQWFRNVRLWKRVGSTLIEDGAITTDKVAANAITAGQIRAGSITGNEIAADTISARNLTITPGNLFPDPYFKDPTWDYGNVSRAAGGGLDIRASGAQAGKYFQPVGIPGDSAMQLEPSATYLVTIDARFGGTGGVTFFSIYARYTRTDGTQTSRLVCRLNRSDATSYKWGTLTGNLVMPGDMGTGPCTLGFFVEREHPDGAVSINNVRLVRAADSSLIVKGGILADHIKAGEITSDNVTFKNGFIQRAHIPNATITSAQIAAIDAGKITSGTIDASKIGVINLNADSITAGKIKADQLEVNTLSYIGPSLLANIPGTLVPHWTTAATVKLDASHSWMGSGHPAGITEAWGVLSNVTSRNVSGDSTNGPGFVRVIPNTVYTFSFWGRAAAEGSNLYIQMEHQGGGSNAVIEWKESKDGLGSEKTPTSYVATNLRLGTTWKKYSVKVKFFDWVTNVRIFRIYWNHATQSASPAHQYLAGMEFAPDVPTQKEIDDVQFKLIEHQDNINELQDKQILDLNEAVSKLEVMQGITERQREMQEEMADQRDAKQKALEEMMKLQAEHISRTIIYQGAATYDDYVSISSGSNPRITFKGSWGGVLIADSHINKGSTLQPQGDREILQVNVPNGTNRYVDLGVNLNRKFARIDYWVYRGKQVVATLSTSPYLTGSTLVKGSWVTIASHTSVRPNNVTYVTWTARLKAAHRGAGYGIRVLVNGVEKKKFYSRDIGPLTSLGSGLWDIGLEWQGDVLDGQKIEIQTISTAPNTSQSETAFNQGKITYLRSEL